MAKVNSVIANLIAEACKTKSLSKQEMRNQVEELEIQRQKHLFESKQEYMIEVTGAVVEGLEKVIAINKNNILSDDIVEEISKFIGRIDNNIIEIEEVLVSKNDFSDDMHVYCSTTDLQYWKKSLQDNINKIIEMYEPPEDLSKIATMSEDEQSNRMYKIGEEIRNKVHFFQSVKKTEDKGINKYFDERVQDAQEAFVKVSRQINADLGEQIRELLLSPITIEVANINLNTDHNANPENTESLDATLAGDKNLESV